MRVTVERDGRSAVVEVADDLSRATIGGRSYPVTVVSRSETRVELEVAGEKVVVENWPDHFPEPPGPVDVNGERWPVKVTRAHGGPAPARREAPGTPTAPRPVPGEPGPAAGTGVAIVPPMPGKVIEVRVREYDRVKKGEVLLVLEAMKMRNEVTSPANGTVRDLRVGPGTNVRAKEPMLFVVPGE
jgi:glutaconyl-CoA/methylmalonyl-CoA decarboxylase subunit gamma